MRRFTVTLGALLVATLASASASAAISKGPYLMFEGSNTQMTVLWQTSATETNTLRWGADTTYSLGQASVGVYGTSFQHKYVITGLQPNTMYYYQVDTYGSGSFRTAPAANATSAKFLAYGDTRTNPGSQEQVAARMRSIYQADTAFRGLVLHTGDWVESDAETNWTNEWFVSGTTYPNMHAFQGEVPIAGVRGNHEGSGTYLNKYYPYTYTGGFYRSFDYGPVHVVIMDTYTSFTSGSAQYNWLVNDLATTTKPWKIIVNHEPGWGAGDHANNTSVQTAIHPLMKQYNVDAFINGHNHNYARCVVENKNYITTGGGGAPLYVVSMGYPYVVTAESTLEHTEISVQDNTMNLTSRRPNGTVIETVTLTHTTAPPAAPTGLSATGGDAHVDLAWAASSGATGYNVKRSLTTGGPYTTVASNVSTTTYADNGLTNGTTYFYVVTAVNAYGESGNSNQASATADPPIPSAPTGLTAKAGDTRVDLSWTASAGADFYYVKRSTTSGGPYTTLTSLAATSYADTGLTNGTTYYYVVSALNVTGESSNSSQASAKPSTVDTTPPTAPVLNTVVSNAKRQITLSWTASTDNVGVTGYDVYRASGSCTGTFSKIVTATASPYTNTGLVSRTTYCYYLIARDAAGNSSPASAKKSAVAK